MIEHDVWVGAYAMLATGITVHTGSIVAARANVTKDVPPYAIVGGNPAKVIKMRFSDEVVEKLLKSQWFHYNVTQLNCSSDIEVLDFIELFEKSKDKLNKLQSQKLTDVLSDLNIPFHKM